MTRWTRETDQDKFEALPALAKRSSGADTVSVGIDHRTVRGAGTTLGSGRPTSHIPNVKRTGWSAPREEAGRRLG
jgi:hypothetical protein